MTDIDEQKQTRARCLTIYSIDMEQARYSCRLLAGETRDDYRGVLIRDVVVSYSRPFSRNKDDAGGKSRLAETFVPAGMRELHRELFTLRNQVFAHSDMTFRKPSPTIWRNDAGALQRIVGFSEAPYDALCARHPEVLQLINIVDAKIEQELSEILLGSGLLLG